MNIKKLLLPILLITLIIALRLLPHAPNFAPVAAVAIISAIYLKGRKRYLIPLVGLLLSDLLIGFYYWPIMIAVYSSFFISYLIGLTIKKRRSTASVISASLLASVQFFILTNLAVWLFGSWYTKDLTGLAMAYSLAVPFFRNTLLGDLFYVGILISVAEAAKHIASQKIFNQSPQLDYKKN